jgi:hypothetical protein
MLMLEELARLRFPIANTHHQYRNYFKGWKYHGWLREPKASSIVVRVGLSEDSKGFPSGLPHFVGNFMYPAVTWTAHLHDCISGMQ